MRMSFMAACIAAFLLPQGCARELEKNISAYGLAGDLHEVRIEFYSDVMRASSENCGSAGEVPDTRSAVGEKIADDRGIYDVNVAIYDSRGMLMTSGYIAGKPVMTAEIPYGGKYTVFAVANAGKVEMPSDIGLMEQWIYSMPDVSGMSASGGLPMCGTAALDVSGNDIPVRMSLALRRLAAEIVLSFRCKAGLEVDLDSVSLWNVPVEAMPFSETRLPVTRGRGDFATGNDIGNLMGGESIRLYMLEDLSAGLESPYINVKGRVMNSSGLVSADVDYRLCIDWEIMGNSRYEIPFVATSDGIYEDSERVEVKDGILQISPVKVSLHPGDSVRLHVPASRFTDISYTSDDPLVVSVDHTGKITALSPGTARVRASCHVPDAAGLCEVEVCSYDAFTD